MSVHVCLKPKSVGVWGFARRKEACGLGKPNRQKAKAGIARPCAESEGEVAAVAFATAANRHSTGVWKENLQKCFLQRGFSARLWAWASCCWRRELRSAGYLICSWSLSPESFFWEVGGHLHKHVQHTHFVNVYHLSPHVMCSTPKGVSYVCVWAYEMMIYTSFPMFDVKEIDFLNLTTHHQFVCAPWA